MFICCITPIQLWCCYDYPFVSLHQIFVIFVVQLRFSTNIDRENPGFAIRNMIYFQGEFFLHQTYVEYLQTPRGPFWMMFFWSEKMMARTCGFRIYPAWQTYKKLLNMAIEIVDLPIKKGDFP